MAKNNATIKITSETKEAESGIKKITGELNKLSKNPALKGLNNLNGAMGAVTKTFKAVTGTIKAAVNAMNELSDAADKQIKAETLLETAAKNNPFMDDYAVKKLKNYANELSNISTYGDEDLLPFMAQLTASGRTMAESQDIMSAAVNLASSGTMSLDSAVKNLNKTYSGMKGELGESIPEIKNLTEEQLKNGDAVAIIARQYDGMAVNTTKATGANKQLANALGDLREHAGKVIKFFFDPIKRGLTSLITGVNNLWSKVEDFMFTSDTPKATTLTSLLDQQQTELKALEDKLKTLPQKYEEVGSAITGNNSEITRAQENYNKALASGNKVLANMYKTQLQNLGFDADRIKTNENIQKGVEKLSTSYENEKASLEEQIKAKKADIAQTQKVIKDKQYAQKLEEETAKINAQKQAYEDKIAQMKLEAELRGEEVSGLDIVNEKISLYLSVLKESGSYASSFLAKLKEEIKKELADLQSTGVTLPAFDYSSENLSIDEMIEEQEAYRQILESLQAETEQGTDAWNKYAEAIKAVDSIIKELKGSMGKDWGDLSIMEKLEFANKQVQSLISSFNEASSLMSETIENQASADTSALEAQYEKGLISEEEYYAQKEKIEKKAAQKKYKIQLAEWALNLLATQSASALAIANSLKEGGTLGMVQAAIMGVQTAVQLASQIASKPLPPSYETGGVVGGFSGASLGEDNTYIHARRGEMMLNASQQKNLYDIANKGGQSYSNNIFVKNEAGDTTRASASISPDGVQITIKKIVNDAMARGEFNNSYAVMKSNIYGRRITN